MIGHFIDCNSNYGDLLYHILLKELLRKFGSKEEVRCFSFVEGEAPLSSGYYVHSIQNMLQGKSDTPRVLIIGGGESIRSYKNKTAANYAPLYPELFHPSFFSYVKKIFYGRVLHRNYFREKFISKYMNYSSIGPWIICPQNLTVDFLIAYCSCGGHVDGTQDLKTKVREAFDRANFIYVRDKRAQHSLLECGVSNAIHVAPDLCCVLSDFYDLVAEKQKGQKILKKNGVDISRKLAIFQSYPMDDRSVFLIVKQLKNYQKDFDCEIALMPVGYCHNDHIYLKKISELTQGAFYFIPVDSIFDMISVIAASDIFLGTSMHGCITAFSFGKPFLIGPTGRDKQKGFLEACEIDTKLELKSWDQIEGCLNMLEGFEPGYFMDKIFSAKKNVYEIFAKLLCATNIGNQQI